MTSSCIWRRLIAVAAVVALASCGDSAGDNNNETDSAVQTDAAVGDAALGDTATADDTSAPADTGTSDTSEGDTASPADTSTSDTFAQARQKLVTDTQLSRLGAQLSKKERKQVTDYSRLRYERLKRRVAAAGARHRQAKPSLSPPDASP